jgi:hypothetical protein
MPLWCSLALLLSPPSGTVSGATTITADRQPTPWSGMKPPLSLQPTLKSLRRHRATELWREELLRWREKLSQWRGVVAMASGRDGEGNCRNGEGSCRNGEKGCRNGKRSHCNNFSRHCNHFPRHCNNFSCHRDTGPFTPF